MSADIFMVCDPDTGRVVRLTIQPASMTAGNPIMVTDKEDATDEQVVQALQCATNETWEPLTQLPDTITWEGDQPWA